MTIKKICTSVYEIELYQTPKGYYQVAYTVLKTTTKTRATLDYLTASYSFDAYLLELEGQ